VCYSSPSSPPLHLSLLPRHTLHAPLRATSDRGSSPRLPGAHVTPLSVPPRTGGVPPSYRVLAFPPPPAAHPSRASPRHLRGSYPGYRALTFPPSPLALPSRQAPPSFHTSPIRIPRCPCPLGASVRSGDDAAYSATLRISNHPQPLQKPLSTLGQVFTKYSWR